jgi:radical SAM protein with 4Fe4S-binding SPASM domain
MALTPSDRLRNLVALGGKQLPQRNQTCMRCKYYCEGGCRRHAPMPGDSDCWDWPNVDPGDWCGEWRSI